MYDDEYLYTAMTGYL